MLCVAQGAAEGAVIIDQSAPPSHRHLREAWSPFLPGPITYDERPLQEALPEALKSGKRMFVLACHACQHLAWQIMEMCQSSRTPFAVCPCCPKDHGGTIKAAAKSLGVDFRAAMILAAAGTGSHPELVLSLWCHVEVV
ncbi:tRNA/tmRNA (Uracil-C(5))-methyltransferase [Durusdinium trenchii]|uniref:tRNA/tmRNA (Uracil-C(5))-methyltransferase n=1 Tax=Durusdinium trenchii TaxID=1381693 RepID=A0ABP0PM20_9DINO